MARPEALIPGNCYFAVGFYDDDLLLPMIDTLVYVGQSDDPDHGRMWLFKEPDASAGSAPDETADESQALFAYGDTQIPRNCRFRWLDSEDSRDCGRPSSTTDPRNRVGPAGADDLDSLGREIPTFLRILSLFAGIGVEPLADYVCNRGRTRVLRSPIPIEQDAIAQLCRRVLVEVYSMHRGDTLNYHFLKVSDVGSR